MSYCFCSASRTVRMKVSSVLATISVNALASMHVTQLGLTGSAGFEDRRNKQGYHSPFRSRANRAGVRIDEWVSATTSFPDRTGRAQQ